MTGGFSLLEPGVSRYHHIGLIVPISAAIFPFLIAPYFRRFEQHHHIITALLLGAATALFAYTLMKFVPGLIESQYTLNKAVLLGLLASEILVFTYPRGDWDERVLSAPVLVFFLFMYLFGISEIERV
jgi:membrane associated rhomboid family serine protease